MQLSAGFKVSRPQIIQETFDDEVVIVDLDSGNYYSLGKTGADVWKLIETGATKDEIVHRIADAYKTEIAQVAPAIDALLQQLQDETLIVASETSAIEYSNGAPNPMELNASHKSFAIPVLQKFTDMQELLLLDPIHEVDEAGWPNVKS